MRFFHVILSKAEVMRLSNLDLNGEKILRMRFCHLRVAKSVDFIKS